MEASMEANMAARAALANLEVMAVEVTSKEVLADWRPLSLEGNTVLRYVSTLWSAFLSDRRTASTKLWLLLDRPLRPRRLHRLRPSSILHTRRPSRWPVWR